MHLRVDLKFDDPEDLRDFLRLLGRTPVSGVDLEHLAREYFPETSDRAGGDGRNQGGSAKEPCLGIEINHLREWLGRYNKSLEANSSTYLLNAIGEAICFIDGGAIIQRLNLRFCEILGDIPCSEGDSLLEKLRYWGGPELSKWMSEHVRVDNGRRTKDVRAQHGWYQIIADPWFSPNGSVLGRVIQLRDVSVQKNLQDRTTRAETEARERFERIQQLERDVRLMNQFSKVNETPQRGSEELLRKAFPSFFCELVEKYQEILDKAAEQSGYRGQSDVMSELRGLGQTLGEHLAGPRDLVEIHCTALRQRTDDLPPPKARAYTDEGRLLLLEMMGYLLNYYRLQPASRASSTASSAAPP